VNLGGSSSINVIVSDTLPDEAEYKSASPSPSSITDHTITWIISEIQPGQTVKITISVKLNVQVSQGECKLIKNEATAEWADPSGTKSVWDEMIT
jgi:hypothetical protein